MAQETIAADALKQHVSRIENAISHKKDLEEDIKELFLAAKGDGFDVKTIRHVIKLRAMDQEERLTMDALTELYLSCLE